MDHWKQRICKNGSLKTKNM